MSSELIKLTTGPLPNTALNGYHTTTTTFDVVNYVLSRGDILAGKMPVFWGPNQDPSLVYYDYSPPNYWPPAGTLARIPYVARFIWEDTELDREAYAVAGFTGTYTYGLHISSFDFDNISSKPTVVFSSSVHTSYPFPQFSDGIVCYATSFQNTYSGFGDYGEYTLTVMGQQTDWYLYDFLTPPFSFNDFCNPNSITYQAIYTAWLLLYRGFSPAGPSRGSEFSAPPYITTTPNGPNSVGCTVYFTGNYSVDGNIYNDGTDTEIPPQPLVVKQGFKNPPIYDPTTRFTIVKAACTTLTSLYSDSTYPYFDTFQKFGYGIDDFLAPVTPTTQYYFGTYTLNILYLSKPRPMPSNDVVSLLKTQYLKWPHTKCIIYIDQEYMTNCNLPPGIIAAFISDIGALCGQLADAGFVYGGVLDPIALVSTITAAISAQFPEPKPNVDPPRTLPSSAYGNPTASDNGFNTLNSV